MPNTKQTLFIDHLMLGNTAIDSAIYAGYAKKNARQSANQLMSNIDVQEEIAKRKQKRAAKQEVDEAWILRELLQLHSKLKTSDESISNTNQQIKVISEIGRLVSVDAFKTSGAKEITVNINDNTKILQEAIARQRTIDITPNSEAQQVIERISVVDSQGIT